MYRPKAMACSLLPLSFCVGLVCSLFATSCAFRWKPSFDQSVDDEALKNVEIAPPEQALTFARFSRSGDLRVLLVRSYRAGLVEGVDVSAAAGQAFSDPIELFSRLGYAAIEVLFASEVGAVQLPVEELRLPLELGAHHIAAGTNYPEHAGEVGTEGTPYLFPKLTKPTPWNAEVSVRQALLDYEVELAFVPLAPIALGQAPEFMGLLLCNDYTDRATLLRHLDVDDVESGKGFTTGKSFPGFLPVGNLFVIPKDYRAFAANVELSLSVNGALRQREKVSAAVWDIDEILVQVAQRQAVTWEHRGERVSLFSHEPGVIQARVLIMTGTPHGVVFNEVTAEQKAAGFFGWLFGGWGSSIPDHAIEDYITDARGAGIYLLTDDRVDIHVPMLGLVRNVVAP